MAITLSNTSVNEATDGIQIGTLSTDQGSGTFSLYFSNHSNFLTLSGSTLSLKSGWFLDFESKYFISNTSTHSNGLISSRSYSSWKTTTNDGDDPIVTIKHTTDGGSVSYQQFTLTVVNKDETISITPTNFKQNQYGATIAQVAPTNSYFSSTPVYFEGPSFLEISGNNLKFKSDYYYSENGWAMNSSGTGWNLKASDYSWDLNFTMLEGRTTVSTDADGDGNADYGYTKLPTSSYLSSIFGNSNINTSAAISLSAVPFIERDYGAVVATINYSGSETVSYALANHTFFEITSNNKIKLKDDYFYNKTDARIEDQNGSFYALSAQGTTYNKLKITATNQANSSKLYTEEITISEISNSVFAASNVDGTAQITISPVAFNDKKYGATIASISYSGSETPSYTLANHSFLELTGTL